MSFNSGTPGASFVSTPAPPPEPQGVDLTLEPSSEWVIQHIGFDGVEKYIRPETYTDYIGKLSAKVDWMKIVGSTSKYEADDESEHGQKGDGRNDLALPDVGPWSGVAKSLIESLQQLNVLLDDLTVIKATDYMKPLTILDPVTELDQTIEIPRLIHFSRGAQWMWKRRALQEAAQVLDTAHKMRQKAHTNIGLSDDYLAHLHRTKFFEELRRMRDTWRVRKTNDRIVGDLSYNIFGTKYQNNAMFEISRKTPAKIGPFDTFSVIEVSVPKDLQVRSALYVSIIRDDITSGNPFSSLEDEDFKYTQRDEEKIKMLKWEDSLKWAQNTLLCREAFDRLCKDAIKMRDRLSIIRDNVLLISLYDDYLLRIELKYYPFENGELKEEGDRHLNRALRELLVGFECKKFLRPQMFIALPVTPLPESLDHRGTKAMSTVEIEENALKPESLLKMMLDIAAHYNLVRMVHDVAVQLCVEQKEHTIQYNWMQAGKRRSIMAVNLSVKDSDTSVPRKTFEVVISTKDVWVHTSDDTPIQCMRDPDLLLYTFKFCISTYALTIVATMSKSIWGSPIQMLHANVHAVDNEGRPAPNISLCNQQATRHLLITFHVDREPEILVRKFVTHDETKPESKIPFRWRRLSYKKLAGSTFYRKFELLFAFIKEQ
ncbi:unnamed protein product [Caenorhabditis bovis]|uniref:Mediator of RNA polymerase II transcription subunit 17 n=1 Tax=Caenorhabditis bovis TaxID=2654633 RepID=A0A8S1EG85_9PELO|nr:unnamed protein product [Caenorhabditis bovis]